MDMFESDTYMELTSNFPFDHKGAFNVSSTESIKSCEKTRDVRISDLEEKLTVAENRCSVLRNQVAYMKMLYTNNNNVQGNTEGDILQKDRQTKKIEGTRTSINNQCSKNAVTEKSKSMPANMVKPLGGTMLTKDPKEAMQMIVNEMTQSVNAVEGTVNIHSNTMEGLIMSSRNKKKRGKQGNGSNPKIKNNPITTQKDFNSNGKQISEADKKPLSTKSKASVVSPKTVKKKPNPKFNDRPNSSLPVKNQDVQDTKERIKKDTITERSRSEATVPRIASSTYLLPTLSYRMKCVPKSCRRQYSFHNIPFVLGKSTGKSHNLGAKIQETLSMIKQSRKGLQTEALEKKEELNTLLHDPRGDHTGLSHLDSRSVSNQSKHRPPTLPTGANSDCKNYQLRTVLMNLHDEFSKMTENYESLKASLKTKFDPEIAQRIQNLEEELYAKEIEINAFMNLYNEVSQLKDQLSSAQSGPMPSTMNKPAQCSTESTSTLKMTRLLRRIEQYQDQLKTMSYV